MARRVVKGGGIETQLYPPRPIVEECVFAGLGKCGSGGWWWWWKSKSRMSDLKKCRLGNLSNKGKLLCERVLLDEDPIQRPEGSMDYIQNPLVFRRLQARLQGTSGAGSHPKSFGVKTVPPVAKCRILQVRSLCPLGLPNRGGTRRSEMPC
jgi:hypothetical protein